MDWKCGLSHRAPVLQVQTPVPPNKQTKKTLKNKTQLGACQWLTPVILATLEAEIRRIEI
jgi:hypothetical protein